MIDLHCHILPGLDDGPSSVAESLAMARLAIADGIRTVVATPHTFNDTYDNPSQKVISGVSRLNEQFLENDLELDLLPGSDAYICVRMADRIMAGEALTINNSGSYILVEFPFQIIPPGAMDELFQIKLKGITPVITHPERNPVFQRQPEILYDLIEMGCLIQVTAMSITGEFGREVMSCAHRLLDLRLAHVIASDAHSPEHRPPILSPARELASRILGNITEAEEMVMKRPQAILDGERVEVPDPKHPDKKSWWFG
ncbi:tyrosine-protein phosphatase [Thermodesulfobacteriota bacterium]